MAQDFFRKGDRVINRGSWESGVISIHSNANDTWVGGSSSLYHQGTSVSWMGLQTVGV